MKILILTSLNPVIAGSLYSYVMNNFTDEEKGKLNILCFPFFAEITDKEYIPSLFAMLKTSLDPKIHNKIYVNKKHNIVIGNTYINEKFDMIVSYAAKDDEIFDTYIELIKTESELKDFAEKVNINNLYKLEDAEIDLPTMHHVKLFLEGVLKNGLQSKSKTNRRS